MPSYVADIRTYNNFVTSNSYWYKYGTIPYLIINSSALILHLFLTRYTLCTCYEKDYWFDISMPTRGTKSFLTAAQFPSK